MTNAHQSVRSRTAVLHDPHILWLDAVEPVMSRAGVDVLGRASKRDEAIGLIEEQEPDLLVAELCDLDEDQPDVTWITKLLSRFPSMKILILSMCDEPEQ